MGRRKTGYGGLRNPVGLKLFACHFDTAPGFDDAHLGGLYLLGCQLPGLTGQRMRLEENLRLSSMMRGDGSLPFVATGTVSFAEARITGQLSCSGGQFDGAGGRSTAMR